MHVVDKSDVGLDGMQTAVTVNVVDECGHALSAERW